jgi:3',5'-cyclic AMP phosphodiesterase CpdA
MSERFILAQISDTHVRADDGGAAARQLVKALAQARTYGADAILLTGDLVNDGQPEEYAVLAEAIADPPAPLFLMPGNHDDRGAFRQFFAGRHDYFPPQGPLSYAIESFSVRIVVIDQIVPGETHGVLTEAQARWLDETLAVAPAKATIVALHHPPFLTHDLLFDKIGLRDADLFASVIARHGQVAHAPVVSAPSTSWAYGLALQEGQKLAPKTEERPGWMLHVWTQNGGVASHVMEL